MLLTPATAELPLVPSCIPISSPPELKTSATLLQKGMDSSGATTTAITTTTRALPQDGTISFPSSEAGESENADDEDDDFLFSTDDEDEENGGTGSNVTTLIEGLGMGRAHGEQGNEEEEVELEEEDPDTRHARAVIAARALYAGIYSLSSFSSPCISRQELVEYDDGVAAYLGFEPMKLILNVSDSTGTSTSSLRYPWIQVYQHLSLTLCAHRALRIRPPAVSLNPPSGQEPYPHPLSCLHRPASERLHPGHRGRHRPSISIFFNSRTFIKQRHRDAMLDSNGLTQCSISSELVGPASSPTPADEDADQMIWRITSSVGSPAIRFLEVAVNSLLTASRTIPYCLPLRPPRCCCIDISFHSYRTRILSGLARCRTLVIYTPPLAPDSKGRRCEKASQVWSTPKQGASDSMRCNCSTLTPSYEGCRDCKVGL